VEVRQALERLAFPETLSHVAGTQVAFLHKLATTEPANGQLVEPVTYVLESKPCTRPKPRDVVAGPTQTFGIVWEGEQLAVHSLAHVNRAIAGKLMERGHGLSLWATDRAGDPAPTLDLEPHLRQRVREACEQMGTGTGPPAALSMFPTARPEPVPIYSQARSVDVHVRHQWPPQFTPPPAGAWVIMQHWEFGSLPRAWIEPMSRQVDEIWVASHWVQHCFAQSGIPADQVRVIPLGVDPERFHPQVTPLRLQTGKRFRFLFVGGTIYRKGIDLLLEAYARAFSAEDDVCLVIKDMGGGSFYRGQTAEQQIAQVRARPNAPEIEYIDQPLDDDALAGLYAACQCLVHPYRGEGFGLPIAEAMACGLPVIVTGYGPATDYCTSANAFLVPARVVRFPEKKLGNEATVAYPWLAEPDRELVQACMRYVVEHPDEARAKGAAASEAIRTNFTWEHTALAIERRLHALRGLPPRRLTKAVEATTTNVTSTEAAPPIPEAACSPVFSILHAQSTRRQRFTANLIVKNEEKNLPGCVESLQGLFDEIIVVDTGSADRTKDIAHQYGARVFDFDWIDSFAAARNACLRHSTGHWNFWMDADDRLDADNRTKLAALFAGLDGDNAAFAMQCVCLPDRETGVSTAVQHVRLFRNHPHIRWEHRVHEQILPAVRRLGGELRFTDIQVQHTGYLDPELRARKRERDLRLLLLEYAELPEHPFTLFNLGMTYLDLQYPSLALPLLERSLAHSEPGDSIVRKLHYLIVQCHRRMEKREEALAACQRGREHYPLDAELLSQEAQLRGEQADLAGAENCYLQLLATQEGPHLASVPLGLHGFRTRHNLGALYCQHGRYADAEAQWRLAVQEQPEFVPSWLGLEELYVSQARWMDLEHVAEQLEKHPRQSEEAAAVRARGSLACHEFAQARQQLEMAIQRAPRSLRPHLLLSHVLLQEGRDLPAAEQALQNVLALDPQHSEALRNLAILRAHKKN
jgi:glycosyltransferase involved in cell wall biosynthesis/tetratricopeptide (TPR) repeat protein